MIGAGGWGKTVIYTLATMERQHTVPIFNDNKEVTVGAFSNDSVGM